MANNIVSQTPSISEVKLALAETANSVGGLCTSTKINKWSKWKPISMAKMGNITENDLKTVNFGLIPPTPSNNYETIVNARWGYQKPTGGASSPYRLGDFRNYNGDAQAITSPPYSQSVNVNFAPNNEVHVVLDVLTSEDMISLSDFGGSIGSYYFANIVDKGGVKYIKTSNANISNLGFEIIYSTLENPFYVGGQLTIYSLLCEHKYDELTPYAQAVNSKFISLPTEENNISEITLIKSDGIQLDVIQVGTTPQANMQPIDIFQDYDGQKLYSTGAVYLKIEITNFDNTPKSFTGSFKMTANPTYWGQNINKFNAQLYNDSGAMASSISIPSLGTVRFNIGVNDLINRNGTLIAGIPSQSATIFSNIQIFDGENAIIGEDIGFKASNT